jgi:hypothetical protein
VFESGIVGGFSEVGERPHAGAIGTEGENAASGEEFHGFGAGVGVAGSEAIDDVGDVAVSFGERAVVAVGIAAVEEDDVAEAEAAMLLFEAFDIGWLNERANSVGSFVKQVFAVDDAGFATKLPWFDDVGPCES